MDKFTEELLPTTVAAVARVLGIPAEVAELAVRHAFDCPNNRCPVHLFLLDRINASTARLTGVPKSQVAEALRTVAQAATNTVELQRRSGIEIGYEQLRSAYDNSGTALDLTMDILMEKP